MVDFYFLGVDGGATKSCLVLLNKKGKKIFGAVGGGLNYRDLTKENFIQNLKDIILKVKNRKVLFGCFSLAGIDTEMDKKIVTNLIKEVEINFPFIVTNDVECVLPAVDLEVGAVIIAGTGSNFYAKNEDKIARAGGLDYLLSDEGSAFYIGQRILNSVVRAEDGRGKDTILKEIILKENRIKNISDLVTLIYTKNTKYVVSGFAPLLEKGLKKRDKISEEICSDTVRELELGIKVVIKKVNLRGNFKICLVGGVFRNKYILNLLKGKLEKRYKNVEIIMVKNPAIGAGKIALREYEKFNK